MHYDDALLLTLMSLGIQMVPLFLPLGRGFKCLLSKQTISPSCARRRLLMNLESRSCCSSVVQ